LKGVSSKKFLYVMPKPQLLVGAFTQRLNLVVADYEIAIGAQQIIRHQVDVV